MHHKNEKKKKNFIHVKFWDRMPFEYEKLSKTILSGENENENLILVLSKRIKN